MVLDLNFLKDLKKGKSSLIFSILAPLCVNVAILSRMNFFFTFLSMKVNIFINSHSFLSLNLESFLIFLMNFSLTFSHSPMFSHGSLAFCFHILENSQVSMTLIFLFYGQIVATNSSLILVLDVKILYSALDHCSLLHIDQMMEVDNLEFHLTTNFKLYVVFIRLVVS